MRARDVPAHLLSNRLIHGGIQGWAQHTLFNFSEDPGIAQFIPRPLQVASDRPVGREWLNSPLVRAIEESHQRLYLFPRECPRMLLWATPKTTAADAAQWLEGNPRQPLAIIERAWLERLQLAKITRFEMPVAMFTDTQDAGMRVSRTAVNPLDKGTLTNLPAQLAESGTELRVVESLLPWQHVSSVHASGIRLRNPKDWPQKPA